jgi:mannose-6-phosphate isomerase-like protein (cupin superfamily)
MNHLGNGKMMPCVAGGVAVGFGLAFAYSHLFGAPSCCQKKTIVGDTNESGIWKKNFEATETKGFTMRKVGAGVECFLEKWDAGTSEPPHSHPGDDSTTVLEGEMIIQFYIKQNDKLIKDGKPVKLTEGMTGLIKGGRIHDVKYVQKCKLVYVHDTTFGFNAE